MKIAVASIVCVQING